MKRYDNSFVLPDEHCDEPLYLASEVDERLARFNAAADLHAQILADKNASIAELERLLREAQYFVSDDFPPAPIETLTIDDVCATPRYFQFWKDLNQALMVR